MNILNGKSTGRRPVMTAGTGNRQGSGEIYINNLKTETLHLALNFGLLKLIRNRSVLSQLLQMLLFHMISTNVLSFVNNAFTSHICQQEITAIH